MTGVVIILMCQIVDGTVDSTWLILCMLSFLRKKDIFVRKPFSCSSAVGMLPTSSVVSTLLAARPVPLKAQVRAQPASEIFSFSGSSYFMIVALLTVKRHEN
jgi:hypothetical protein